MLPLGLHHGKQIDLRAINEGVATLETPGSEALFDFEESGTERTGLTRYPKARNRAEVPAPQCITLEKPIFIEPLMQFCFDVHGKEFRPTKRLRVYAMLDGTGTFETV